MTSSQNIREYPHFTGLSLAASLLLSLCLVLQPVSAANAKKPTAPPKYVAKTVVGQEAAALGVKTCLPRLDQMTDFLFTNSGGGVHTFFPAEQANTSLLSTSFEVISNDVSSYASASFAPVGASGCGAVYEAVTYWQNDCDAVASKVYVQMKKTGVLKQRVQVLEAGTTARVFLMPAGTGCISIKKEALH